TSASGVTTSRPVHARSTSTSGTCARRRKRAGNRVSCTQCAASATSSASREPVVSLRWRIAAALGVVAALVMAFGAIAAYVSTSQRLEDSVDESLLARASDYTHFPSFDNSHGGDGPTRTSADDDDFSRPTVCPQAGAFAPASAA